MFDQTMWAMLGQGILETLYMTLASTALSYLFGLPLGVLLVITDERGIWPHRGLKAFLDTIVNITRSIPFLILLIAVIPFTRFVVGTTIGSTATVVPLVLAAIPFIGAWWSRRSGRWIPAWWRQPSPWVRVTCRSSCG